VEQLEMRILVLNYEYPPLCPLELARAQGFAERLAMISPGNAASLRTVEKTGGNGIRVVRELRYVKVLSKVYSWSS
jgi:hypothetical protein